MVSTTFQFSGDDSVFFWHWTCRRMRESCCVPRNGKKWQSGQSSKSSSFSPAICLWGDNAETEVMLAVCLGGSALMTLVLIFVHPVGLVTFGEKRGSKRVILPPQTAGKPFLFERLSAVVPWTPLMWALWLQSLWWSFAWQQREKVGESAKRCWEMMANNLFFWWWNHDVIFRSKIYCFLLIQKLWFPWSSLFFFLQRPC